LPEHFKSGPPASDRRQHPALSFYQLRGAIDPKCLAAEDGFAKTQTGDAQSICKMIVSAAHGIGIGANWAERSTTAFTMSERADAEKQLNPMGNFNAKRLRG
jgi:hypothetical protein